MGIEKDHVEVGKSYDEIKLENKQLIIRNEFGCIGKYGMPLIRKQEVDLDTVELMGYTKSKVGDEENSYKTIHFFTYDWLFDTVYDNPEKSLEKLKQYYALLTPDFSMYTDMPMTLQIHSTFKNRWCGAYWQSLGLKVIPTIEWGDERSFDFCFEGVEQGAVVAVATYCREDNAGFMQGYNKMLEIIKPAAIICYGEKFNGMNGNVKFFDPYNSQELIKKIGAAEFLRKQLKGELYPASSALPG